MYLCSPTYLSFFMGKFVWPKLLERNCSVPILAAPNISKRPVCGGESAQWFSHHIIDVDLSKLGSLQSSLTASTRDSAEFASGLPTHPRRLPISIRNLLGVPRIYRTRVRRTSRFRLARRSGQALAQA